MGWGVAHVIIVSPLSPKPFFFSSFRDFFGFRLGLWTIKQLCDIKQIKLLLGLQSEQESPLGDWGLIRAWACL